MQFTDALAKQVKLHSSSAAAQTGSHFISDTFISQLLTLARSDDLEAKRTVIFAVAEVSRTVDQDAQLAVRLATILAKVLASTDRDLVRDATKLFASLLSHDGMSRLADVQMTQALEWLRGP